MPGTERSQILSHMGNNWLFSRRGKLAHQELSVYWLVFLVGNVLAWSFSRLKICNFDKHLIAPGKTIFSQKINDVYCATGQR